MKQTKTGDRKQSTPLVAPSILSADFARLGEEVQAVEKAGADWIHVDVMDGHFVPNLTIGAPVVRCIRPVTKLPLDVHLMIEKPEKYLEDFAKAGADYLTVHVEACEDVAAALMEIRNLGVKPGLTLRPRTPVEELLPYLALCDLILIMTVELGFGGQSFMSEQTEKARIIRHELEQQGLQALIEVDGGVNADTIKECQDFDVLVAGSFIFKNDYVQSIQTLKGLG